MPVLNEKTRIDLWNQAMADGPKDNPLRGIAHRFAIRIEDACLDELAGRTVQSKENKPAMTEAGSNVINLFQRD